MRELMRSRNRKLLGVAAGCAAYAGADPTLWRAAWTLGGIFVPPLILAYLILAVALPMEEEGAIQQPPVRVLTKSRDRLFAGVAAGVAEYLELDPTLVRFLFVASLFAGGSGLLIYLVLYALMPKPDYTYGRSGMQTGDSTREEQPTTPADPHPDEGPEIGNWQQA